jgi:type VI secretion system secreted protein VgrG
MPNADHALLPALILEGKELTDYEFVGFRGIDELNEPYRFDIELLSRGSHVSQSIRLDSAVGCEAKLQMRIELEDSWGLYGVITEATQIWDDESADRMSGGVAGRKWRLVLRSPVWLLTTGRTSRVFKDKTVTDILKTILGDYGLSSARIQATSYVAHATIQLGESDFDLAQRLLAEEGLLWATVCDKNRAELHAANSHDLLCPRSRWIKADIHDEVRTFHATRRATFAKVGIATHDIQRFDRAAVENHLVKTKGIKAGPETTFFRSDHHGGMRDGAAAHAKHKTAKLIAERANALANQAQGTSTLHRLGIGSVLDLSGHPDRAIAIPWMITRIEHVFESANPEEPPTYRNSFTCVPFEGETMRPALREPPRVAGLRLGVVVSNNLPVDGDDEPGSTQSTGLYEVAFPSELNHDQTVIQRMRLAHPWAGPDRGFHFPLDVNDEVVVSHEHGDPARPFILGCLYSSKNKGPLIGTTGGQSTSGVLRSRTGHELRFDDEQDAERILLGSGSGDHQLELHDADKKVALTTKGDLIEQIDRGRTTTIGGNRSETVSGAGTTDIGKGLTTTIGEDETVTVGGSTSVTIGKDRSLSIGGDDTQTVSGKLSLTVSDACTVSIAADTSVAVDGGLTIDVGKNLSLSVAGAVANDITKELSTKAKKITFEAEDELVLKCGGAKIILKKSGDITIEAGGKMNLKASADMILKGAKLGAN